MPVNATARKFLTDLLKAVDTFHEETAVRFNYETVGVEGTGSIDNIGIPLIWDESLTAFKVFVANADRADTTAYAVGDVVKLLAQDGNEYVAVTAGTSAGSPPAFNTGSGEQTIDGTVVWVARAAYTGKSPTSPLKNKSLIAVTVGDAFGLGFNKKDTALSATPANMTVIYRGDAALITEGFIWGSVVAADQAEFLTALEQYQITTVSNAEAVSPTFTS